MKHNFSLVLSILAWGTLYGDDQITRAVCGTCPITGVARFCGITAESLCVTGPIQANTLTVCGTGNASGCTGGTPAVTVVGGVLIGGNLGVSGTINSCSGIIISGTGNTTGCTGAGSPALIVDGGEFINGNLGVSGNISACGFINNNGDFRQNDTTILVEDAPTGVRGNLFVGFGAGGGLASINNGTGNTYVGNNAGAGNPTGSFYNTALGFNALQDNMVGNYNVALGVYALQLATGASSNVAVGTYSLGLLQGGASSSSNVAVGHYSLGALTNGHSNIAIGNDAGSLLIAGQENIYIGNGGTPSESFTIRIGDTTPHFPPVTTFVAGIHGITPASTGPLLVIVDSAGQLGTTASPSVSSLIISGTGNPTGCTGLGNPALSVSGGAFIGGTLSVSGPINTCTDYQQNSQIILVEDTSGDLSVGFHAGTGAAGNTNVGNFAGSSGVTGIGNTNIGSFAGFNSLGAGNANLGQFAGFGNTLGNANTNVGEFAGDDNVTGNNNTALGAFALADAIRGDNNIAVGSFAGASLSGGSNNIYIGSTGLALFETGIIRIGATGIHTACFIPTIANTTGVAGGSIVVITPAGLLGVTGPTPSSARFKEDIVPMNDQAEKMIQLRPVEFVFKNDASKTKQYGLIAEEVAEVYPTFIVRDSEGQIFTIEYTKLIPILLQQIQLLQQQNKEFKQENIQQNEAIEKLNTMLALVQEKIGIEIK